MKKGLGLGLMLPLVLFFSHAALGGSTPGKLLLAKNDVSSGIAEKGNATQPDAPQAGFGQPKYDIGHLRVKPKDDPDPGYGASGYDGASPNALWSPAQHSGLGSCKEVFDDWCDEYCGDASPSSPGGSERWGKQCTPGKLKHCEECGFLD